MLQSPEVPGPARVLVGVGLLKIVNRNLSIGIRLWQNMGNLGIINLRI